MYVMLSGHSSPIPFLFVCCFSLVPCFSVPFFLLLCPLFGSFSFVSFVLSSLLRWWFCCSPLSACGACGLRVAFSSRVLEQLASVSVVSLSLGYTHHPSFHRCLFPFCLLLLLVFWSSVVVPVGALRLLVLVLVFSSLCLLCCVLVSWGGVLAGWLCCVGVVYVFSLCLMPRRRKVLPPM